MTAFLATEPRHALREYVPDPGAQPPACDEREFAAIMEGMVADEAPRLFAVVQEYGERVDAVIAAWGMAFPEHAEIMAHRLRMSVRDPESALHVRRGQPRPGPLGVVEPERGHPTEDGCRET